MLFRGFIAYKKAASQKSVDEKNIADLLNGMQNLKNAAQTIAPVVTNSDKFKISDKEKETLGQAAKLYMALAKTFETLSEGMKSNPAAARPIIEKLQEQIARSQNIEILNAPLNSVLSKTPNNNKLGT